MNAMQPLRTTSRRDFFARVSDGLLGATLTQLLCDDFFGGTSAFAAESNDDNNASGVYDLSPKPVHHPATARSVIQLFMNGGPSQMDLFDPKPVLNQMDGKPYPGNVEDIGNQGTTDVGVMMGGQYRFDSARRIRTCDRRCPAAYRGHGRRPVLDSFDVDRPSQPRQRPLQDSQWSSLHGIPDTRCLDGLRIGIGEPESSCLCRAKRSAGASQERHPKLDLGIFASGVSGHAVSTDRLANPSSQATVRATFAGHRVGAATSVTTRRNSSHERPTLSRT